MSPAPIGPFDNAAPGTVEGPQVRRAIMATCYGRVEIHALSWSDEQPYVALCHPRRAAVTRLRLQAQCLTSTAFNAQMCDCRPQIEAGVRLVATCPGAVLVYLPQEGRGHGLLSKVEVMAAMNTGLDLAQAQASTGRPHSRLSYRRIPQILHHLDLRDPVVLLTESEDKIRSATAAGVHIACAEELPL